MLSLSSPPLPTRCRVGVCMGRVTAGHRDYSPRGLRPLVFARLALPELASAYLPIPTVRRRMTRTVGWTMALVMNDE